MDLRTYLLRSGVGQGGQIKRAADPQPQDPAFLLHFVQRGAAAPRVVENPSARTPPRAIVNPSMPPIKRVTTSKIDPFNFRTLGTAI